MSMRIIGKHIHVARAPMASGSGGGGDGPPKKPKLIIRMLNWLKAKMKKLFS